MKRLIPATIAFILLILLTLYSHFVVNDYCKETSNDMKNFSNKVITSETLTANWRNRKEKMSAFVNHDFLDQISLYIGQMTLGDSAEDEGFAVAYKNVETLLDMIKEEQRLAAHSFY